LAVTDWRLRRWRLWFLALMTATRFAEYQQFLFVEDILTGTLATSLKLDPLLFSRRQSVLPSRLTNAMYFELAVMGTMPGIVARVMKDIFSPAKRK